MTGLFRAIDLGTMLARRRLRRCASVGEAPRVLGRIWIRGDGAVRIGHRVVLDASTAPIELYATYPHSEIVLGDDVLIESGSSLEAERSIRIGDRTRIGRFCRLMDSHFHPVQGDRSKRPLPSPVVVESDVELGAGAILVAGAYLEHHVVVFPGTVITRRIRAEAMVRGVPCQVVTRAEER
jgi:acetyltransferase-like isoleucine patch superfamily enzyme